MRDPEALPRKKAMSSLVSLIIIIIQAVKHTILVLPLSISQEKLNYNDFCFFFLLALNV